RHGEPRPARSYLPGPLPRGPARIDLLQDPLERVRAVLHVLHHPGPEAAGTDLARHQVRGVESAGVVRDRVRQDGCRVGQDLVRIAVGADVDVGRDPRRPGVGALRALDRYVRELLQEVDDLRTGT